MSKLKLIKKISKAVEEHWPSDGDSFTDSLKRSGVSQARLGRVMGWSPNITRYRSNNFGGMEVSIQEEMEDAFKNLQKDKSLGTIERKKRTKKEKSND